MTGRDDFSHAILAGLECSAHILGLFGARQLAGLATDAHHDEALGEADVRRASSILHQFAKAAPAPPPRRCR